MAAERTTIMVITDNSGKMTLEQNGKTLDVGGIEEQWTLIETIARARDVSIALADLNRRF